MGRVHLRGLHPLFFNVFSLHLLVSFFDSAWRFLASFWLPPFSDPKSDLFFDWFFNRLLRNLWWILAVNLATCLVVFTSSFKLSPIQRTLLSHRGLAKIRAGDPRNASKIDTKPHRKWDKNYNRKTIPKSIKNQPKIKLKYTLNPLIINVFLNVFSIAKSCKKKLHAC